jgi:valyl-tRNA synthetase
MGWPEETQLLKTFYPTSVLVTGFDILFFWVARMMMMGIHFMNDVPFKDVYVHALVRDEEGKKMSKSKGNVIDPLTVMDQYGTDAFRFTLAAFAAQGRDIKMSEKRVEGYRHFINKLWNASRFALMHVNAETTSFTPGALSLVNRWILSRSDNVFQSTAASLEAYHFNEAAGQLYHFVWHELCDWYLEAVKPALYGKEGEPILEQTRAVLWQVLKNTLIRLHPFIPFVTEEIWHMLPGTEGSIMTAELIQDGNPGSGQFADPEAERQMAMIIDIITGIRNVRGEMNLSPTLKLNALIQTDQPLITETIQQYGNIITHLARLDHLAVSLPGERPKAAATAIVEGATIYVPLEGILDLSKEIQRMEKEIGKLNGELSGISKKLSNDDFLGKAPADIIEKVKEKHAALSEKQQNLLNNLDKLKAVI